MTRYLVEKLREVILAHVRRDAVHLLVEEALVRVHGADDGGHGRDDVRVADAAKHHGHREYDESHKHNLRTVCDLFVR